MDDVILGAVCGLALACLGAACWLDALRWAELTKGDRR